MFLIPFVTGCLGLLLLKKLEWLSALLIPSSFILFLITYIEVLVDNSSVEIRLALIRNHFNIKVSLEDITGIKSVKSKLGATGYILELREGLSLNWTPFGYPKAIIIPSTIKGKDELVKHICMNNPTIGAIEHQDLN